MTAPKFYISIDDGEPLPVDDNATEYGWQNGAAFGVNYDYSGTVVTALRRGLGLYFVNATGLRPDGTRWGFTGCYRRGEWREAAGMPVWCVWEQLA